MTSPRVTVVIATYNRSELLPFSIGSVLRQTFADFELLVVGDGCTDDSERVAAEIGDPRVRWIGLPENSGHQSAPNNEAIRQARGEFIAYLGHDDLWLPHHLQQHVKALDAEAAEFAYSLCATVAADGSPWPVSTDGRRGRFSPPTCMTHRRDVIDAIGGWRDYRSLRKARTSLPDLDLWQRGFEGGSKFAFVRRLTAIKFPGSWRRNSYRLHAFDEQAAWLARIDSEPELENTLLLNWIVSDQVPTPTAYRDLLRLMISQTSLRLKRRFTIRSLPFLSPKPGDIDDLRRFKGLQKEEKN